MKGLTSVRLGVMIAALFAAGVAGAQGPGAPAPVEPGAGPGFANTGRRWRGRWAFVGNADAGGTIPRSWRS